MEEGLKNRAYLEGQKLKKSGYDNEVIFARLEKQGIPEELARQVIMNLSIQQRVEVVEAQKPFMNVAVLKIGIGVFLAILSAVLIPGKDLSANWINSWWYTKCICYKIKNEIITKLDRPFERLRLNV